MLPILSLALLCLCEVHAVPAPRSKSGLKIAKSENVLNLKRIRMKADSSRALLLDVASDTETLNSIENDAAYGLEVNIGGDNFDVIFDTGSSDLWVFHQGVQCLNANAKPVPDAQCGFGPEFQGNFDEGEVDNQNFLTSYASGEVLLGDLGFEKVSVGDVTVDRQKMALVDQAYWAGDGETSGIFGFARSSITSAYAGNNPAKDNAANNVEYTNWIDNAIEQGKIDPVFSVVLERDPDGGTGTGQVALGGLPKGFDGDYSSTPIEKFEISPDPDEKSEYSYYTITADNLVINGASSSADFPSIVDTGTTLAYFPSSVAAKINAAYDPPSKFIASAGVYENDCGATPPEFAITIGGTDFKISADDLLLQGAKDPVTGGCITGIQSSGMSSAILGDVFLHNVVAVFDIGNEVMKFAPHTNY